MPNARKTAFATFDGAAASAYLYERAEKRLSPLTGFPMIGQKKPEFLDKLPRVQESAGESRSAIERRTDPEKEIEQRFVAKVAARLEALRAEGAFDSLIVAAPPRPLGYWREAAPKALAAAVKKELASDYAHLDEHALLPIVEKACLPE